MKCANGECRTRDGQEMTGEKYRPLEWVDAEKRDIALSPRLVERLKSPLWTPLDLTLG